MTVPWTGFPLANLVRIAEPLGSAKFVVFETAADKSMPGLRQSWYPWPYIEALTIGSRNGHRAPTAAHLATVRRLRDLDEDLA